MNSEELSERIIQDHTTYALAAGAIPIPLADVAAVAVVQLDLVRTLAKVYRTPFDPATGKALIASLVGASAARLGASIAKAIPGVGWVPAAVAQAGFAGASTYAIGHLFRAHFAREGTLQDLDADSYHPLYEELLDQGRRFVASCRAPAKSSVEETATLLERLARLRDQNVLDATEFENLKRRVVEAAA